MAERDRAHGHCGPQDSLLESSKCSLSQLYELTPSFSFCLLLCVLNIFNKPCDLSILMFFCESFWNSLSSSVFRGNRFVYLETISHMACPCSIICWGGWTGDRPASSCRYTTEQTTPVLTNNHAVLWIRSNNAIYTGGIERRRKVTKQIRDNIGIAVTLLIVSSRHWPQFASNSYLLNAHYRPDTILNTLDELAYLHNSLRAQKVLFIPSPFSRWIHWGTKELVRSHVLCQ